MSQPKNLAETTPVSAGEVLQGASTWLRMLAQAGVTQLPRSESPPPSLPSTASDKPTSHGPDSDGPDSSEASAKLASIWEQMIEVPSPTETARPQPTSTETTAAPLGTSPAPTGSVSDGSHRSAPSPSPPIASPRETAPQTPAAKSSATPVFKFSENAGASGPPLADFPDLPNEQRTLELTLLKEEVQTCQKCPELVKSRTKTVFGTGHIRPRLVLMGEAPGAEEDRMGEPMVGPSGQLLDKIIAAMKMKREDVYILNTIKCHPRQNRNPLEAECVACRPFWERQLELLRPELIVCLGAVASKTLLQTNLPVGALRGTLHDYRGTPVVVTYHPSYLLRTESAKRQTWDDMKIVMKLLRIDV